MTKFFKTTISVEVLSEHSGVGDLSLADIAREIDEGDCVGRVTVKSIKRLTPKKTAEALSEFGSDPSFYNLDEKGKDLDDQDDHD